jgi:hypothetical protein
MEIKSTGPNFAQYYIHTEDDTHEEIRLQLNIQTVVSGNDSADDFTVKLHEEADRVLSTIKVCEENGLVALLGEVNEKLKNMKSAAGD